MARIGQSLSCWWFLALPLGHRYSFDFDFFSQKSLMSQKLPPVWKKIGSFQKENFTSDTIHDFLGIKIADPKDIAAMKPAITDRGTKRDFVDFYFGLTVEKIFKLYDQKYHLLEANLFNLIKGLQDFIDAKKIRGQG